MQQNWQVSPPACFWLHRSAKGLIFSIFTDSHKIARSNSVVSAFVKIETGRSRICLSEAMASALASPNARSCAQRRISYACVPHPAFSSRSRYPAIKLSVSRSSKSQRILLPPPRPAAKSASPLQSVTRIGRHVVSESSWELAQRYPHVQAPAFFYIGTCSSHWFGSPAAANPVRECKFVFRCCHSFFRLQCH
jgi:hypothetical protein